MKRNIDYVSDEVRNSVKATMSKVQSYFEKNWKEGQEYKVIKHIHSLLSDEIDKYIPYGAASKVYFQLTSLSKDQKKYDDFYAKNKDKYGQYVMELLAEYAHSLALTGRYDVGERYHQVSSQILDKKISDFTSEKEISVMLDKVSSDIEKFLQQHNVEKYTLDISGVCLVISIEGDITLEKKDAPRGRLRYGFKKVTGSFICDGCGLTSLYGIPEEVGGDFDCSNNRISSLSSAPKKVGGNFICLGNEPPITYSEIKSHSIIEGRIITDAPLTPEEKKDFKDRVIKEQHEFQAKYEAMGKKAEQAIETKNVKILEECREFYYNAIDFFKERPWLTDLGMKMSYQILMKLYVHLHEFNPEKYPDTMKESSKLSRLTNRRQYSDGFDW